MADTMLSNVPPVPVGGQALQIVCSSAVPQYLQGQVTVTLFGPDGSMLANTTGATRANAVFSNQRATPANSGVYECRVTITSPFLMSGGTSRALQDTATLTVDVPRAVNATSIPEDGGVMLTVDVPRAVNATSVPKDGGVPTAVFAGVGGVVVVIIALKLLVILLIVILVRKKRNYRHKLSRWP